MLKQPIMRDFAEKERAAPAAFSGSGPYWHAFTSGKETPVLFTCRDEYAAAMNQIAKAAAGFPQVSILTFAVMSNHFHFVAAAAEADIRLFWERLRRRLSLWCRAAKGVGLSLKAVADLDYMRKCIVYVNRNGYVANPEYNPFSYPWGAGLYYFAPAPSGKPLQCIGARQQRALFKCREPDVPGDWQMSGGYVLPVSYCDIGLGMSMFRDSQHYFAMVSKNVEGYAELSAEFDDGEFLTDDELYGQMDRLLSRYGASSVRGLTKMQRLDLARMLRRDFRSSNSQIRRVLHLTQYEVDTLYPLTAAK